MAFKYAKSDQTAEDVIKRSRQKGGVYDTFIKSDVPMLKIREGDNQLRIFPPTWSLNYRQAYQDGLAKKLPPEKAKAAAAKAFPEEAEEYKKWGSGWAIDAFIHYRVGPDRTTFL